jgi:uncharacterized LabA/DUF88 family protein
MRPTNKTTAILVDGSNLYAANKALGFTTDYHKLLHYFGGDILRAAYFTALPPDNETSSLRPMVDYLEFNGWTVYQKATREFYDPVTGQKKVKGNMDVEMSVIAMELAPYITDLVLFSGDGDFRFLVETVQRHHAIRVTVVSTIVSRPPMIAGELRRQADKFIDLVDIQGDIKRTTTTPVDAVQDPKIEKRFRFLNGG